MKHIKPYNKKPYNKDNWLQCSVIHDLEDCLLEIFEKYDIKKEKHDIESDELDYNNYFINDDSELVIEIQSVDDSMDIFQRSSHIRITLQKLYSDILSIQNVIEKRIKHYISIRKRISCLGISIEEELNESNKFRPDIHDLEDCLQEVFDKYNVSYSQDVTKEFTVPEPTFGRIPKEVSNNKLFYSFFDKKIYYLGNESIVIGMGTENLRKVKQEIENKKEMIQSRLNRKIEIGHPPNDLFMFIRFQD